MVTFLGDLTSTSLLVVLDVMPKEEERAVVPWLDISPLDHLYRQSKFPRHPKGRLNIPGFSQNLSSTGYISVCVCEYQMLCKVPS